MSGQLPPSASVATPCDGDKLFAPAADRNAAALCDLLKIHAPKTGSALEIASGTGQHVVAFARSCPGLLWHPTEIEESRLRSIDAHRAEAGLTNLRPAQALDATQPGWHADHVGKSLTMLINLLHLISERHAKTVIQEALATVKPNGCFILYGPFKRHGMLTSKGDNSFDAQLRAADPMIGYKDDADITAWIKASGARHIQCMEMPANNLAFLVTR